MLKYTIFFILILFSINKPNDIKNINQIKTRNKENIIQKDIPIGKIKIERLKLENNLFDYNSSLNTIEQNVAILEGSIEPEKDNSIMFLAAHSGTGSIAFFQHLDQLKKGDLIQLQYKNKYYTYYVKNYWEQKKTGEIDVPKESYKQLVLTTCSPTHNDKQLIINCILKES